MGFGQSHIEPPIAWFARRIPILYTSIMVRRPLVVRAFDRDEEKLIGHVD